MITGIVLGCYAVAWLFTARVLYGRWRGVIKPRPFQCWSCWSDLGAARDAEVAAWAIIAGALWPAALLVALVVFRPPPTAAEQAAENAKLTKRIGDLERELNLPEAR
jgi:hypothetical protein